MRVAVILMNRDRPELADAVYEQIEPMAPGVEKTMVLVEAGSRRPEGCSRHMTHWFRDRPYRGRYHAFSRGLDLVRREHGDHDFYWFVVNDITFGEGEDALGELLSCMAEDERMGLIGPAEPNQEWYPGAVRGEGSEARWGKVATVHGLAQLIRGEVVHSIGYMNPKFHYSQGAGTEYAYKLNRAGWFLAYAYGCSVEHAGGSTYGKVVPISRHEYQRRANRFASNYLRKNYGEDWPDRFAEALPKGVDGDPFRWQKDVWEKVLPRERRFPWFWRAGSLVKQGLRKVGILPRDC